MLARGFRVRFLMIAMLAVVAVPGCRGYHRCRVCESRRLDAHVAPPHDWRSEIRSAPTPEHLVHPAPAETPTAPALVPPAPSVRSGPSLPGIIEPEHRGAGSRRERGSNPYFEPRLDRRRLTGRDPIAEPVESQRKLVPQDSGLPRLFNRLGASFRRIGSPHGGS
jgi:hypothetical protein